MKILRLALLAAVVVIFYSFKEKKIKADLIVYNGRIYTVDQKFSIAESFAVKDGKLLDVGTSDFIRDKYSAPKTIDAHQKFIYPGFIDAHAHFHGYALSLRKVNLMGTESWNDVISKTMAFKKSKFIAPGEWITGRGWDQNDWPQKQYPDVSSLDSAFPDNPVLLIRVDGHAAMANTRALKLAGIKPGATLTGGEVVTKNNKLTGLLIDNAVSLVGVKIPATSEKNTQSALIEAEHNCFQQGLTTIADCGLDVREVAIIKSMHDKNMLKMRLFIMLSDEENNFQYLEKKGKIITPRLNVSSFKVYADGALGSRGACLLQPYADDPSHTGFLKSDIRHFDSVAARLYKDGFQMCTHAIGDSGNRVMLNIYAKYLKGKNDRRWRIEHAQVVNENDFHYFGNYNIVPSVQPTHATSDMYWAGERLGAARVKNAYAYKNLQEQNGWIPLGTDFPVEDISPIKTFFASVFRKDAKGYPASGYQTENSLSRKQTLLGMTLWAAKSFFQENEKGSLEKGKLADFIILDTDIMEAPEKDILATKVLKTVVNGEVVY